MRKNVCLLLILSVLLALCACGKSADKERGNELPGTVEDAASETAKDAASEEDEGAAAPEPSAEPEDAAGAAFRFETTTLSGERADESLLSGHKLTMINFFEPWCPPCVAELPELEKLYETYAPEGFQILGVFSTEEGVEAVLAEAGVGYPVLRYVPEFDRFQTGYVPTTIFLDEQGNLVGETVIGSKDYSGWEELVKELMK